MKQGIDPTQPPQDGLLSVADGTPLLSEHHLPNSLVRTIDQEPFLTTLAHDESWSACFRSACRSGDTLLIDLTSELVGPDWDSSTVCQAFWKKFQPAACRSIGSLNRLQEDTVYLNPNFEIADSELSNLPIQAASLLSDAGWEEELKQEAAHRLKELGIVLRNSTFIRLHHGGELHHIAVLDFYFSDDDRSSLLELREELEQSLPVAVRFQQEFSPDRPTRIAIARAERDGLLITPHVSLHTENLELLDLISTGKHNPEGIYYHDYRRLPTSSADSVGTHYSEDAQFGFRLPTGELFIADHVPNQHFPHEGFLPDRPVITYFVGFVIRDGEIVGSNISTGLVQNSPLARFSHADLAGNWDELRTPPEVRESLEVQKEFALQRRAARRSRAQLPDDTSCAIGPVIVQEIREAANGLFYRFFEDTGVPILCRDQRVIEQDYLGEIRTLLPEVSAEDLQDGLRLGQLLLNLQEHGPRGERLFHELGKAVSQRSHHVVVTPEAGDQFRGTTYFKAHGLFGRTNQVQLNSLLWDSAPLSMEELEQRAIRLDEAVRLQAKRNFALIARLRRKNLTELIGQEMTGFVRFASKDSLFVHARRRDISGVILPDRIADLPLSARQPGARLRVLYEGYSPLRRQNIFSPVSLPGDFERRRSA